MTDIQDKIDRAIRLHVETYHDKQKRWRAPTVEEMLAYQNENPDLACLDVRRVHKMYSDGGWKDTHGKPVRNWKLKLWTLARMRQEQSPKARGPVKPAVSQEPLHDPEAYRQQYAEYVKSKERL